MVRATFTLSKKTADFKLRSSVLKKYGMKTRIHFLDHLRTLMIFLVVVLHAGLVYERVLENTWLVVDPVKADSIGLIRMYLDLFIMFIIFFISGYLIPTSVKGKSSTEFVVSKVKRIILPWLIAVLTLIPAYKFIFLYSRGLPQEEWYSYFHFFERTGADMYFFSNNPAQSWLWFLPVLFVFQVIYLVLSKTKALNLNIGLKTAVSLIVVIATIYGVAIAEFGLTGWYDTALLHFQRERLLVYFLAFLLGSLCFKLKVFESDKKNKRLYLYVNIVLTLVLGIFTVVALNSFFNLIDPQRNYYFISAFGDRVVYYLTAILSQLSILYLFLYSFRHKLNKSNALMNELNSNSYYVYIIHMIVMGVIALTLIDLPMPGMLKFIILSILTFAVSNVLLYAWRLTKQKKVNFKTITVAVVTILIIMAAFGDYPTSAKAEIKSEAPKSSSTTEAKSIHAAVVSGDLTTVKQLVASGVDLNEKEPVGGSSPLISACVFNQTEIALFLIESGADINFRNNDGSTALHTAAFFCRTELVKALLSAGADKYIKNNAGSTAAASVLAPFEMVKGIYEYFGKVYEPLGLKLDLERIEKTRPVIAEILK